MYRVVELRLFSSAVKNNCLGLELEFFKMEPNTEKGERVFTQAWHQNMSQIDLVRTVLALATGAFCGILGLTSLWGLLFYIAATVVIGLSIAARMAFNTKMYTNTSLLSLVFQGMQGQAMTFVMSWTLAYSIINLF